MTEKRVYKLVHEQARQRAAQDCQNAQEGWVVTVSEPTRTLDQNAALWPALQAFADQLQWPVNGKMVWLSKEEWKDLLSAAFTKETARVAPGINGGMVLLGERTSQFKKQQFSDFLEFIHATAAEREVDLNYLEYA